MNSRQWISISALNHYAYCARRCALIHQEQTFAENRFTIEGDMLHQNVDIEHVVQRPIRQESAMRIWSDRWRISGIADLDEWNGNIPYPVDYKRGRRKEWFNDDVQLCAQALCLEEMFDTNVLSGAIYHAASRHRREVAFTEELPLETGRKIERVRALLDSGQVPQPTTHRERCTSCSMIDICLPNLYGRLADPWDAGESWGSGDAP